MAYDIRKDKNPMAVNILKLQRYNFKFFSLEEVILFEYLVIKGSLFKYKPFYHSSATIAQETGIKRNRLETIIKRFISLKLITIEKKGMPKVKHWLVNYPVIPSLFGQIYQFSENGKLTVDNLKLLNDFYKPFVDGYQKKNIKEEYLKENKKEKEDDEPVLVSAVGGVRDYFFDLKNEFSLNASQVKHTDLEILNLLKSYNVEEIKQMARRFFEENTYGAKISDFLKTEKAFPDKNIFIEKTRRGDFDYAKRFLEKLEQTFNDRREMITEDKSIKKGLSKTSIVINDNIVQKAIIAIKEKGELAIEHAFISYADSVLKGKTTVQKLLPFFFARDAFHELNVIDNHLDNFNINYSYSTS